MARVWVDCDACEGTGLVIDTKHDVTVRCKVCYGNGGWFIDA